MFEFHINQTDDDVIVTSFKFSPNNCPFLKLHYNIIDDVHLMIKVKVTLTDDEGHR